MEKRDENSNEEQELIRQVSRGERSGYTGLMKRYGRPVMAVISRLVADSRDAEELAQDTFVKAFIHIDSYDASKASLRTWLLHIAFNTAINHLRDKNIGIFHLEEWMEDTYSYENGAYEEFADDAFFKTGDRNRIKILEESIDKLLPEEQLLLSLYYYDNLSMQEISQIMKLKPSTLNLRLFRIRRKLHDMIEHGIKDK